MLLLNHPRPHFCVCCGCRGTQQTSLEQSSPPQSNTPGTPPSYKLPPLLGNYEGKDDFPLRKTGFFIFFLFFLSECC